MTVLLQFTFFWSKFARTVFANAQVSCLAILLFCNANYAGNFQAGPLFSQSPLTLDSGQRTEAFGPLFYDQKKETEKIWALAPLFSHKTDPAVESREDDFLYPLVTYERYGREYRWQLIQLFSFSGGQIPDDGQKKQFTLFPFYFQQRAKDPDENYTAVFPFYGHLKNRLFRDEIFFVAFPAFSETKKRDVVTDNYFYPFFHLRRGDGLSGWQFWPFVGNEHKEVTTQTNDFGDVETIGGHGKFFALWPIYFRQNNGIGTSDPEKFRAALPFYALTRSPKRDVTSILWPFFAWIDDRGKKYREWQGPWPFVIFTRGEGKTTSRVWPLFSRSHNDIMESDSYFWPLYRYKWLHTGALDQRRTRVLFYLFENTTEKNTETGKEKRRMDAWPFFTYHRDFDGNNWLQIFAPLEPVLPNNRGVENNWLPLWSVWRSENNPKNGASSRSLFWNFYRSDKTPTTKKCSLLFGLFQYQSGVETKKLRLFFIPVMDSHKPVEK